MVCDLVVLTWNRVDLLRPCLERLLAHTRLPSRLIVVDNGSTDPETLRYLQALPGAAPLETDVIRHPTNLGIAAALNSGLRASRAPWICLLNNDVLVTEGWLEELLAVAQADPAIGLVNPMSNQFGLTARSGETIDELARRCRAARGRWVEHATCEGFCMLVSRQVLEQVGLFDEGLGPMFFEDADYALRVRRAGRLCVVAEGAYVFHQGSATIKEDPGRDRRFAESEARFARKWGLPPRERIGWVLGPGSGPQAEAAARRIRALAGRHKVWVFAEPRTRPAIPRHLQVVPVTLPRPVFVAGVLWRILTKKKRFHRLVVDDPRLARLLRGLAPLHRAAVRSEGFEGHEQDG